MTRYLLDSSTCVFFLRGKYGVGKAIRRVGLSRCCISEVTELELKIGAEISLQKGLNQYPKLNKFLKAVDIYPISSYIDLAAKEKARLREAGTPLDDNFDLLIGVTAAANNMVMVTDNIRHFKNLKDIQIENWTDRTQ